MLSQKLIESALGLTGKSIEDMVIDHNIGIGHMSSFSIEKFNYYLLSPEFIEKYFELINHNIFLNLEIVSANFGIAIHAYQKGNEQPLEDLLSKIK